MYVKESIEVEEINFLKSQHFISYTYQADASSAGVSDGILPAGTVYPANDATAIGITINDVDVSNSSQPVGVIVEGHILFDRLLTPPSDAAIGALKNITFYDEDGNPKVPSGE